MKARAVVGPDGSLALYIDEGEFAEGKAKLAQIVAQLQAQGVTFKSVGIIEQHRHTHVVQTQKVAQGQ